MYKIIISKKASEFILQLDKGYKNKIKTILYSLKNNPFSYPYKKIRGETNLYRIRVGKYRILYEVNKKENLIVVLKIDHRRSIYKWRIEILLGM